MPHHRAACCLILLAAACTSPDKPAPPQQPQPGEAVPAAAAAQSRDALPPSIKSAKITLATGDGLVFDLEVTHSELPNTTLEVKVASPDSHIEDTSITLDHEGKGSMRISGECTGRGPVLVKLYLDGERQLTSNQLFKRCSD